MAASRLPWICLDVGKKIAGMARRTSHVTRHTSHVTLHASQIQTYRILKVGDGTVEVLNQRVEHLCTGYEMPIVMAMIMMMMVVITLLME